MADFGAASWPGQMGNVLLRNNQDVNTEISEDTHVSANIPGVSDQLCCPVVQFPLGFCFFGPTLCRWRALLAGSKCGNDKIEIQDVWISLELQLDTPGLTENPAGLFHDPLSLQPPQHGRRLLRPPSPLHNPLLLALALTVSLLT